MGRTQRMSGEDWCYFGKVSILVRWVGKSTYRDVRFPRYRACEISWFAPRDCGPCWWTYAARWQYHFFLSPENRTCEYRLPDSSPFVAAYGEKIANSSGQSGDHVLKVSAWSTNGPKILRLISSWRFRGMWELAVQNVLPFRLSKSKICFIIMVSSFLVKRQRGSSGESGNGWPGGPRTIWYAMMLRMKLACCFLMFKCQKWVGRWNRNTLWIFDEIDER